jgi:hypothetical protein
MFHRDNPRCVSALVAAVSVVVASSAALAAQHWGPFKDDGCRATDARQFSSILEGIPWGASWEQACWSTPGLEGRVPDRCVNAGGHIWGEWDVVDKSCAP